tara:strand:+ start:279 stop:503 length:225 start_codon:yes stop_codon:yes gene_type:complete
MAERIEVALDGITAVKFSDKPFKSGILTVVPKWAYSEGYKKSIQKADRAMLKPMNGISERARMYNAWKDAKEAA